MVYVVRHGRTAFNAAGRLRGHRNVPLDDVGRAEAAALGHLFRAIPLSRIYSSPLSRATDTAAALSTATGVAVVVDNRLVDRDYGLWAGESRAEVEAQFGSLDGAPGVECGDAVVARVMSLVHDLHESYGGQRTAIVAHDSVNRFLIGVLCNLPPDGLAQPTGCWNLVTEDDGRWMAVVIGATPGDGELP